jgi:hypothetical protein
MVWMFSPAYSFFNVTPPGTDYYWQSLFLTQAMGWLFLGAACLYLPLSWRDGDDRWLVERLDRFKRWCEGSKETRIQFRKKLVDQNPFFWLVSRWRLGPHFVWALVAFFALAWVFIGFGVRHWVGAYWNTIRVPLLLGSIILLHTLLKMWIALESVRHFELQRRGGFLEVLLACTPMRVPDILHGQWLSLQRQFFGPVIVVLLVDAVILMAFKTSSNALIPAAMFSMIVMLCVDCMAIAWVGMWMGISTKRAGYAFGKTFWRILVMPWLVFFLVGSMIVYATHNVTMIIGGWTILGVINSMVFGIKAEHGLSQHFQLLACIHNERPSLLKKLNPLDKDSIWLPPEMR